MLSYVAKASGSLWTTSLCCRSQWISSDRASARQTGAYYSTASSPASAECSCWRGYLVAVCQFYHHNFCLIRAAAKLVRHIFLYFVHIRSTVCVFILVEADLNVSRVCVLCYKCGYLTAVSVWAKLVKLSFSTGK